MKNIQNVTKKIIAQSKDLEILKKHFSHCFDKNGKFDFAKFKKELSKGEIDFSKESYGMDWLGKSYARLLASDPATTLLKEDKTWNNKPENHHSQNLLIKGDNLEVLKHLSNAYHEKIKMIYIDPPYNTGSDGFVYEDDRKFTVQELAELAGIDEEKAKRILDFTRSKSNSHSAWLTFMYPRLYIAKQLLRDDGVIFVSIDDNEVAQLRILMDEIFGEENFVGSLIWKKTENIKMDSKFFSENKDYVIVYKKNNLKEFNKTYSDIERYNLEDEKGKYYLRKLEGKHGYTRSLDYVIEYNGEKYYPGGSYKKWEERQLKGADKNAPRWLWSKEKFYKALEEGEIVFKNGNVYNKVRYDGIAKKPFTDFLNVSSGQSAQKELDKLFDDRRIFDHPKPVDLIQNFLKMVTSKNQNDLILDFFAGSGTTGDAVMQLNAEDGGNRKYILVQLPEPIDEKKNKTAYDFVKNNLGVKNPTIFEITKERLIRSAKKIKEETINKKISEKKAEIEKLSSQLDLEEKDEKIKQLKQEIQTLESQDLGFKIFETMPIWEGYDFKEEEFSIEQKLFDENQLNDDDLQVLLTTWKTYDEMALTDSLEKIDLDGYTGYYGNGKLYLVNKGFETKNLKALLNKIDGDKSFSPVSIIVFGYNFESKALREIAENIANYANKKKLDIDFITRY
jgi:adenine-specific DNA-methyltransferase